MEATNKEVVDQRQYLTFNLVDEEYAIGILRVKEILQYDTLTRVPSVPVFIRGVINLRGNVVTVVDLARKFGIQETPITKRTCIVIVEVSDANGEPTEMGVMADSVSQVVEFAANDIQPPPSFGSSVEVDYLEGMGKLDSKFALILDIDRVLSADELVAVTTIEEALEKAKNVEAGADDSGASKKGKKQPTTH